MSFSKIKAYNNPHSNECQTLIGGPGEAISRKFAAKKGSINFDRQFSHKERFQS